MAAYPPYQTYPGPAPALITPPPILVAAADPAPQQRLTVFLRFILLLPHLIVLCLMGIAVLVVAFIGWWGALFTARLPLSLCRSFVCVSSLQIKCLHFPVYSSGCASSIKHGNSQAYVESTATLNLGDAVEYRITACSAITYLLAC